MSNHSDNLLSAVLHELNALPPDQRNRGVESLDRIAAMLGAIDSQHRPTGDCDVCDSQHRECVTCSAPWPCTTHRALEGEQA